jgi:hypothetical protein
MKVGFVVRMTSTPSLAAQNKIQGTLLLGDIATTSWPMISSAVSRSWVCWIAHINFTRPPHTVCVSLGIACPLAILDTVVPLSDQRLCMQRDLHPEEYSTYSGSVRYSPQSGKVSGLVRMYIPPVDLI